MSRVEKYVCDCCGREIPTIKRKDILGIERVYLQSGELKSLGVTGSGLSRFNIDFCEDCAHKIDMEIMQWKLDILSK